ncbi:hypothetical protein F5B20DRAFT_148010 [Whalleya microplaca]|nr:hypothetical protein F5B20DRAFT_148010 [Whalleya microplaca]
MSKPTRPGYLIPARNSRHRTACLALYRALLQQADQVPLPDDLATAWGPRNPIRHLVRRTFVRNRRDTSPRLIYPAMKAGYRILALLNAAHTADTPDHASVVSFLRARLTERERSLDVKTRHLPHSRNPKLSTAPNPTKPPLFVNVTPAPTPENPDPKPEYAIPSRPRPLEELGGSGRRRVPHMDLGSDIPFLRLGKPQPAVLGRVLTQTIRKRIERMAEAKRLVEDGVPEAQWEDDWEREVTKLMTRERRSSQFAVGEERDIHEEFWDGNTFRQTNYVFGIKYLNEVLTRQRQDQVARADAMRRLIKEEKALAMKEQADREALRHEEKTLPWEAQMQEAFGEKWRDILHHLGKQKVKQARMQKREPHNSEQESWF